MRRVVAAFAAAVLVAATLLIVFTSAAGREADTQAALAAVARLCTEQAGHTEVNAAEVTTTRALPTVQARERNFATIIAAGRTAKVEERGIIVALAVVLVESDGLNLASRAVPESLKYPHDVDKRRYPPSGVPPGDHDSINPFQQRVSKGWMTSVREGMKVPSAAASFYRELKRTPGWGVMSITGAAQAVQRSAFPMAYAAKEGEARAIYKRLAGTAKPAEAKAEVVPAKVSDADLAEFCGTDSPGQPADTVQASGSPVISGRWAHPIRPARSQIGSPFGAYRANLAMAKLHKGQDLMATLGTVDKAPCDGVVTGAGWDPYGGGNQVTINCGGSIVLKLMHHQSIQVKKGQAVRAGQNIAHIGSTGNSTGPHLHVQVEIRGKPVNPVPFFKARGITL